MRITRWLVGFGRVCAVAVALGLAAPAPAQDAAKSEPSPIAPGDLSKPVFDTTKSVYEASPGLDKAASTMVAEVEGHAITLGDVGDTIRSYPPAMKEMPFDTLFPSVVERLIRLQALVIRAQNLGLDEDPAVRRKTREATAQVLADAYIRHEAGKDITETALLERYQKNVAGKPGPEEVHVRVIMVPTREEADSLMARLKAGADFGQLAHDYSKDTTAVANGDLGFVTRRGLNAEIGAVAFAAPPGQIVPYPVPSIGSWFIIRVEDRRQRPTPTFAEVHDQLRQLMVDEAAARIGETVTQGFKVRRFDVMGQEIGVDPDRPARLQELPN